MEPNIQWANHLWDEWKYRHEVWGKTFYRSMGFVVTLAVVPWVKTKYFELDIPWAYGFLPLILFVVTALQLAFEYTHLIEVEDRLSESRGGAGKNGFHRPHLGLAKVFLSNTEGRRRPILPTVLYLLGGLLFWAYWFCLFQVKHPR